MSAITQFSTKTSTILSHRHYKQICFFSLIFYLVVFVLLGVNAYLSSHPVCPYSLTRAQWTRDVNIFTVGGFFITISMQINRVFISTFREDNDIGTLSSYYASIVANVMSGMSHLFTLLFDYGGSCIDVFGNVTPATLWPDLIISAPLLAFITLSVDDKPFLSRTDIMLIVSIMTGLTFGYLMISTNNFYVSVVLKIACVSSASGPAMYIMYRSWRELNYLLTKTRENESKKGIYQRRILLASRKLTLALCFGFTLPILPSVYILSLIGIISQETAFAGYLLGGAGMKLLFTSLCMDAHLEVSHPAIALIDAENFSHTSRRAFLRYVFHEVRVPLNSIALGIQVLTSSDHFASEEMEAINHMKDAVNFMGETLNDVMALQKVEEGSLELIFKPFHIQDLLQNVEDSFLDIAQEHSVQFSTQIDEGVPFVLVGDKFRIRHVLANLVSNAIKFSFPGGKVLLKVCAEECLDNYFNPDQYKMGSGYRFKMIKFIIVDEGKGISEVDQEDDIFQPYRQLKHGELQSGRGSGLGLAICKEIVHMHGGQISYTSMLNHGSTFTVLLPMQFHSDSDADSPSRLEAFKRKNSFKLSRKKSKKSCFNSHLKVLLSKTSPTESNARPLTAFSPFNKAIKRNYSDFDVRLSNTYSSTLTESKSDFNIVDATLINASESIDQEYEYSSYPYSSSSSSYTLRDHLLQSPTFDSPKEISSSSSDEHHHPIQPIDGANNHTNQLPPSLVQPTNYTDNYPQQQERTNKHRSSKEHTIERSHSDITLVDVSLEKTIDTSAAFGSQSHKIYNVDTTEDPAMVSQQKHSSIRPSNSHTNLKKRVQIDEDAFEKKEKDVSPDVTKPMQNNDSQEKTSKDNSTTAVTSSTSPNISKLDNLMRNVSIAQSTTNNNNRSSFDIVDSSKINVLIVDDVNSNRKLLALLLVKLGIGCISFATNGQEALDMCTQDPSKYDIIFMDNTMPIMSGIECSQHIRNCGYSHLIIGVTGNTFDNELQEFYQSGADLVVMKPMNTNILKLIVTMVIAKGPQSFPGHQLILHENNLIWKNYQPLAAMTM